MGSNGEADGSSRFDVSGVNGCGGGIQSCKFQVFIVPYVFKEFAPSVKEERTAGEVGNAATQVGKW